MKKICSKCGIEKEISCFSINRSQKDGFNHSCKECHRIYVNNHYKNNKKQYIDRNNRRQNEAKKYITDFKKNSVCAICGEKRWWVLDFHHNEDKLNNVGHLTSWGINKVKEEIEKCMVLCSNCHRDLHYKERNAS
jgi:hypothetical protein